MSIPTKLQTRALPKACSELDTPVIAFEDSVGTGDTTDSTCSKETTNPTLYNVKPQRPLKLIVAATLADDEATTSGPPSLVSCNSSSYSSSEDEDEEEEDDDDDDDDDIEDEVEDEEFEVGDNIVRTAGRIVDIIQNFETNMHIKKTDFAGRVRLLFRIEDLVRSNARIDLTLPATCFKPSDRLHRTVSSLSTPERAFAEKHLNQVGQAIADLYSQGARITLTSDVEDATSEVIEEAWEYNSPTSPSEHHSTPLETYRLQDLLHDPIGKLTEKLCFVDDNTDRQALDDWLSLN